MNRRKIIYGAIYIGVVVAFPTLPLAGLRLIINIFTGGAEGLAESGVDYAKSHLWSTLNPFD